MAIPIAVAGSDQVVDFTQIGVLRSFDGGGSYDPDGDPISAYAWTLKSKPPGSAAALVDAGTQTPDLTPDVVGSYLLHLRVQAGGDWSAVDGPSSPNTAYVILAVTTEHLALRKPAEGERGWSAQANEWAAELDALDGKFDAHASQHNATSGTDKLLTAAPAAAAVRPGNASPALGSSEAYSKADHTHQVDTAAPATVSTGTGTNAEGSSSDFARGDHTHRFQLLSSTQAALPAPGPPSGGRMAYVTDVDGGQLQQSGGASWYAVAPGIDHDHDGANSAQVAHSNVSGVGADDHHTEDHKARHATTTGADPLQADSTTATTLSAQVNHCDHFDSLQATGTAIASEAATGGTVLEGAFAAQLDQPRNVQVELSLAQSADVDVEVNGVDAEGGTTSETITVTTGNTTAEGAVPFSRSTSIVFPVLPSGGTCEAQMGNKLGLVNGLDAVGDVYKITKNGADVAPSSATIANPSTGSTVDLPAPDIAGGDDITIRYTASHTHTQAAHQHDIVAV